MKKHLVTTTLLGLALAAQAGVIQFNLSPAGTEAGTGLSPLNEFPAVTNSTGSGNELGAGISLDTNSLTLTIHLGFGSAAGFTDLTAPASGLHIHGPAAVGANGPVVVNLAPYLFSPADPATGGILFGQVPIPTNAVESLLASLNYINIHTTNNPSGEIRGQLIPILNSAPVVSCPVPATVECGGPSAVTVQVSDPDNDALTVVWSVNGVVVKTSTLAAGTTGTPKDEVFTAEFPLGTNVVSVTATDTSEASASCSTRVVVVDTISPLITNVKASPNLLWPPSHKMVSINVSAAVADICGGTSWKITSITSSEAPLANGSGQTAVDWEITGDHTAKLRAERSGITGPRTYTITIEATDTAGNASAPKTVTVKVPHSKSGR